MFPDTPHISAIKGLLDEGHMAHKVLFHGPVARASAPLLVLAAVSPLCLPSGIWDGAFE